MTVNLKEEEEDRSKAATKMTKYILCLFWVLKGELGIKQVLWIETQVKDRVRI